MRCLTLAVLLAIASGNPRAQSEPPRDTNVVLHVSLVGDRHEFQVGETIPIRLDFSSDLPNRYEVNTASYDRSGRMEYEHFDVRPSDGVVDPLANRRGSIGGGLTGFRFLTAEPWSIQLNVNEWLRFTKPGEYRIAITSRRVGVKDPSKAMGTSPISVAAKPITLTIVPATAAWQQAAFEDALATLNQIAPAMPQQEAATRAGTQALDTLRFLGTPNATRELVNRLGRGQFPNEDSICQLGLIGSPQPEVVRKALDDAIADPDRGVNSGFLYVMLIVNADFADHEVLVIDHVEPPTPD